MIADARKTVYVQPARQRLLHQELVRPLSVTLGYFGRRRPVVDVRACVLGHWMGQGPRAHANTASTSAMVLGTEAEPALAPYPL